MILFDRKFLFIFLVNQCIHERFNILNCEEFFVENSYYRLENRTTLNFELISSDTTSKHFH